MRRLMIASLLVIAAFTVAPAAQADPGGGALHVEFCSTFFPGSDGGKFTLTPSGNVNHACRYPGPGGGGGVGTIFGVCMITPAGNINCN
jgi:hypothetical protein